LLTIGPTTRARRRTSTEMLKRPTTLLPQQDTRRAWNASWLAFFAASDAALVSCVVPRRSSWLLLTGQRPSGTQGHCGPLHSLLTYRLWRLLHPWRHQPRSMATTVYMVPYAARCVGALIEVGLRSPPRQAACRLLRRQPRRPNGSGPCFGASRACCETCSGCLCRRCTIVGPSNVFISRLPQAHARHVSLLFWRGLCRSG